MNNMKSKYTPKRLRFWQENLPQYGMGSFNQKHVPEPRGTDCADDDYNLVSSLCDDGMHRPVLDVDGGLEVVESSTPGHYHLYFDTPMRWDDYAKLLNLLAKYGMVDKKWVHHSLQKNMSTVRPPHVKKEGAPTASIPGEEKMPALKKDELFDHDGEVVKLRMPKSVAWPSSWPPATMPPSAYTMTPTPPPPVLRNPSSDHPLGVNDG